MEIREMNIEQIEARFEELKAEVTDELTEERCAEINAELEKLEERKAELRKEKEERDALAEKIANENVGTVKEIKEKEERTMYGIETKEYRDAFFANLVGNMTEEQRGIFADNTNYGDGVALPVTTDKMIWDQVSTAHPILNDVDVVRSGLVMKVTKSTPAAVTGKKDSAASAEQTFTNVDVTLAGIDYHTFVTLSFAEAKMSAGAMEKYLAKEVADAIGESLAKAVFARILADCGTAQKITATDDVFKDVKDALAKAVQANDAVIYAPASEYYKLVGDIKSGSPYNIGTVLGCQIKKDNAATKITVVDPAMVILNVVQDVTIDSSKDLTKAAYIIGGYCRAEACLRKTAAAAYIA